MAVQLHGFAALRALWTGHAPDYRPVFMIYLKAFLPDTEIPAAGLLAEERRPRPRPYAEEEIVRMQQIARTLWEPGGLKQITFETLIGLLASTGLRIGEALRLILCDVH
jgi:integrase